MKPISLQQNMKLLTAQDVVRAKENNDKMAYATLENRENKVSKYK